MEKLHISDCAVIVCTNEQEDAVNMIVEGVACIRTSNENEAVEGEDNDSISINAAEYNMWWCSDNSRVAHEALRGFMLGEPTMLLFLNQRGRADVFFDAWIDKKAQIEPRFAFDYTIGTFKIEQIRLSESFIVPTA